MKRKIIIAIADGVGDRPIPELGDLTPLQYAKTPTLDYLAKTGVTGIMDVHAAGIPVGTDTGHLVLFGYGIDDYPGRGPLEAAGVGMQLLEGDVAFRCNFATVDNKGIVLDRRAGRIREKTNELAKTLNGLEIDGVKVFFKEATEHRAVLLLRGVGLKSNVTDSDPKAPNEGVAYKKVTALDEDSQKTADVLNKILLLFHEKLENHPVNIERREKGLLPANFILTRGAGLVPKFSKITNKLGFNGACIAGESTVLGVANLAGYEIINSEEMTANLDTNIKLKAKETLKAIEKNDIVYVHLKAPDLFGHDNDPKGKVKAIELFDKLLEIIVKDRPENTIIALAADHSTPCEKREHSGEPVPIVMNGPGIRVDKINMYNEIECAHGGLGRIKGYEFINLLFDYMEVTKKVGN